MILQPNKPAGRRRLLYLIPAFFAIALLAGCGGGGGGGGGGGTKGPTITVQGQITDPLANPANSPVDGVTVTLVGNGAVTTTSFNNTSGGGVDGWYSLSGVPANSNVNIKYTDSSTGGTVTENITNTGSTTYTENINYPFSLGPPP